MNGLGFRSEILRKQYENGVISQEKYLKERAKVYKGKL